MADKGNQVLIGVGVAAGFALGIGALVWASSAADWREVEDFAKANGKRYVLWEKMRSWSPRRPVAASNQLATLRREGEAMRDGISHAEGWDAGILDVREDRRLDSYG